MKWNRAIGVFLLLVLMSGTAYAQVSGFTGREWSGMSHKEKFACVMAAIVWMDACKVPLSKSPNAYIQKMDDILSIRSDMEEKDLATIMASIVYQNEPQARRVINSLRSTNSTRNL